MKKLLGILLAVIMLLSCFAVAEEAQPALANDLIVLFTSDVHCGVEDGFGYVGVAQVRDTLKAQGNYVLLVDNGDGLQGAPVGTMTAGEANIKLMNAVGYDIATIGNHDFDYGMDRFFELTKTIANFPYVSCNFNKDGELQFDPYIIKEFDGVKIAFLGITTPKTLTTSTPTYFMDENGNFVYGFFQGVTPDAFYAAVQNAVDAARAEGANYVVAMAHLGNEAESVPYTYADVIANTTGINAMLDGHSHDKDLVEMTDKNGDTVLRAACGTKLEAIGYLKIATDGTLSIGQYTWDNDVSAVKLFGIENDVTAALAEATESLNAELSTVVAHTDVDLIIKDPETDTRVIRSLETNLGDLCADAYRTVSGADVAIVNGGGIRAAIKAGDITKNDILTVHPFGNEMCVCEVTGQEILDALELSAHSFPGEFGGFLQVSGMTFEIHTYIESSVTFDENSMFTGVTGEYRVKNVMIGDEPLDLEKTYTLASHNYKLKNMGDGYNMFADNVFTQDSVMLDNQVLLTYINDFLGGNVGEEYADIWGQGRIIFVEEAPAA